MNRNHYLAIGTVVLAWGLTFNSIQRVTLHEHVHNAVEKQRHQAAQGTGEYPMPMPRTIEIPSWIRYAFISAGAVLMLHGAAMKKPGK